MQMVLLYKDPHGRDSGVVNSQTEGTFNRVTSNTIQSNELEKKMALLEKVVLEKDKIIAELRNENSAKNSTDQSQVRIKKINLTCIILNLIAIIIIIILSNNYAAELKGKMMRYDIIIIITL